MSITAPATGRFFYKNCIFSQEGLTLKIYAIMYLNTPIKVLEIGENIIGCLFRHDVKTNRDYMWVVCRSKVRLFDITDLFHPVEKPNSALVPTNQFKHIGVGFIDQDFAFLYTEETKKLTGSTNEQRRLVRYNVTNPLAPARLAATVLGNSGSGSRGGNMALAPNLLGRRYLAVTYSATKTAMVDITSNMIITSNWISGQQAVGIHDRWLYGHGGQKVETWWSVYKNIDTIKPIYEQKIPCEGFFYDNDPNLTVFTKAGNPFMFSGFTDGNTGEFVRLFSIDKNNGRLSILKTFQMPKAIEPVFIDIVGNKALIWGYPPHTPTNGWEYYVVTINITKINTDINQVTITNTNKLG